MNAIVVSPVRLVEMYWLIRRTMSAVWREHLQPDGPGRIRINKHGSMKTDAILVADSEHLGEHADDRSPNQLVNTASLDGIVGNAWAMADWHFGYGFPIGGVVATDINAGNQGGAISPGGVGFDINCGVRLCALDINFKDINAKVLAQKLANSIPAGATGKGGVIIDSTEIDHILSEGANAAIEMGWGESRDLASIESNGRLETNERNLGERAKKRGSKSLGTLGSGNHFLELQVVDSIVDEQAAKAFAACSSTIESTTCNSRKWFPEPSVPNDLLPLFFALSPRFLSFVSNLPLDSIDAKSLDSPHPISIAALAPSDRIWSISVESIITPPLPVAPAGIELASF